MFQHVGGVTSYRLFLCLSPALIPHRAGAVAALPKFTSHKVRQLCDAPDAKPYSELAAAYSSKSSDRLGRVAEQHMAAFTAVRGLWTLLLLLV
jgi:hypothetical protein